MPYFLFANSSSLHACLIIIDSEGRVWIGGYNYPAAGDATTSTSANDYDLAPADIPLVGRLCIVADSGSSVSCRLAVSWTSSSTSGSGVGCLEPLIPDISSNATLPISLAGGGYPVVLCADHNNKNGHHFWCCDSNGRLSVLR